MGSLPWGAFGFACLLVLPRSASAAPNDHGQRDDYGDLDTLRALLDVQVVAPTKRRQRASEAPAIVTVISRAEIEHHQDRSVADALRRVPGLFINSDHVIHDVGMRGVGGGARGGSRRIKFMIDGQPISFRNETIHLIGPEFIPMDAVERIEIVRGPSSALYGANAFLGVVNVVTREGKDVDGAVVRVAGTHRGADVGTDLAMMAGRRSGALDVLVAFQRNNTDRSGLRLPCTTFPNAEDPCAAQRTRMNDPRVLDRTSFEDVARPSSFLGRLTLDMGTLFDTKPGAYGHARLLVSHQSLDSRGAFSDWGMLAYDEYTSAADEFDGWVPGSGNRVAISNTTVRAQYAYSLDGDRLEFLLSGAFSQGGPSGTEHLRDDRGHVERARAGYESYDLAVEVSARLIDGVSVLVEGDFTQDDITYAENKFVVPLEYRTSPLRSLGLLGQLTGSHLDQRINWTAGVRFDSHRGARLTVAQLSKSPTPELTDALCDGRVCYSERSYRFGLSASLLRHVGEQKDGGHTLEDLYLKATHGTAFMPPSPSFLYDDADIGAQPFRPNPSLRPQLLTSSEFELGTELFGGRLGASVVLSHGEMQDGVVFTCCNSGVVAENAGDVSTRALEATLHGRWGPFDLGGTVSHQLSERTVEALASSETSATIAVPDTTARLELGAALPL